MTNQVIENKKKFLITLELTGRIRVVQYNKVNQIIRNKKEIDYFRT